MKRRPPEAASSEAIRQRVLGVFGFAPELADEMLHNLAVADAYLSAFEALKRGTLVDGERHVVMLAVSAANDSTYCVDMHRALACAARVQIPDLDLIRRRQLPVDSRLQALTQATWRLIETRGQLDLDDIQDLDRQGVEHRQIYEIIAIIGVKTIANYIEHIGSTRASGG